MKKIASLFTMSALLTAGASAAPFLAVGDGAEIFVTGVASVRTDSNIFLAPSSTANKSATVFEVAPGLELVFGKSSTVQGTWSVKENFSNYSSHSDLNTNQLSTNFAASYSDGKSKGSVNASYVESDQNQVDDTGTAPLDYLVHRNATDLGAKGEVSVTQKTSIGAGIKYAKVDYQRKGFSDSDAVTIPLNYFYEVTPKVDLSLGYQYRATWVQIGEDTTDSFFNVGARGEFTPKLSGQVNVGVTQRSFTHLSNKSLFGVDANLSYAVSPKTSLQFGGSNDFDTNSQGQQQKNFALRSSVNTSISEQWSLTGGVNYRSINYYTATPARTDSYIEAQVGATYIVNTNFRVTGSYVYKSNDSDVKSSNFEGNALTITANFRY